MSGGIGLIVARKSLADIACEGAGFSSWVANPNLCTANTAPTSQRAYVIGIGMRAGTVVSNIHFATVTAGTSTAPTNIYCGLAASDGTMLGVSADVAANAAWTSTGALATIPLTAAYTVPTDGVYYAVFLQNGTWAGTAMTLLRGNANFAKFGSVWWVATESTRTNLSSSLTFSASNFIAYWAAVS